MRKFLIVAEFCKFCISWEFILWNCTDCVLIQSIPQNLLWKMRNKFFILRIYAQDAQISMFY